jgi:uncharacterized RDD family membrane protein YckC
LVYAGFWWRVLGYFLDGLIIGLPYSVLVDALILGPLLTWLVNHANQIGTGQIGTPGSFPLLPTNLLNVVPLANLLIAGAVGVIAYALYFGVLVSVWGRTVGQLAVGARVVREEDPTRRLPLGRALARAVVFWVTPVFVTGAWLSGFGGSSLGLTGAGLIIDALYLVILLALLWVAWDPQKQGLHDKLGRALVVRSLAVPRVAYAASPYPAPYPYPPPYPYPGASHPYPAPPGSPYAAPPGYPQPAPPPPSQPDPPTPPT